MVMAQVRDVFAFKGTSRGAATKLPLVKPGSIIFYSVFTLQLPPLFPAMPTEPGKEHSRVSKRRA